MSTAPKPLEKEAQGDWCGFKGAAYHLTYATWLLLKRKATEVTFYAGNDLLAHPTAPPADLGPVGTALQLSESNTDEWIQIKNCEAAWTCSAILADSIVPTFVLNALLSESRGRTWSVRLATTSPVRTDDILRFTSAPADHPELNSKLGEIVDSVRKQWTEYAASTDIPAATAEHIHDLTLQTINQLVASPTAPHELLLAEIELELTKKYHDSTTVRQVASELSGVILGAIHENQFPKAISIKWLEEHTQRDLQPDDLLSNDPVEACRVEIERARPSRWSSPQCITRPLLNQALVRFLDSDSTLFVLVGESGSGKSWSTCNWALNDLCNRRRAWINATALLESPTLVDVVANAFRPLARAHATNEEIFRTLTRPLDGGAFVIVADDLLVGDQNSVPSAARLESICQEARNSGLKLVLVTRPFVWRHIYSSERLGSFLYQRSPALGEISDGHGDPAPSSYRLSGLDDNETRQIVERCLPRGAVGKRVMRQLRRADATALRNPYLLSICLAQWAMDGTIESVDGLLDREIQRRFKAVAFRAGCDASDLDALRTPIAKLFWEHRQSGVRRALLIELVETALPSLGTRVLSALQFEDVVTPGSQAGTIAYANPQLGDRLTVLWLATQLDAGLDVSSAMKPGLDDSTMTALVRSAPTASMRDIVGWCEQILSKRGEWLPSLAEGLAQNGCDDWRLIAALTAWSNRQERFATWHTMRALGGMAATSGRARYWISSLYADEHHRQHFKGEIALGRALEAVAKWVERRVRVRLRRDLRREAKWMADSRRHEGFVRSALEPLRFITNGDSAATANSVSRWVHQHYSSPIKHPTTLEPPPGVAGVLDQLRGRAALYGHTSLQDVIINDLQSPDIPTRLAAARAIVPIAEQRTEAVLRCLVGRLPQEGNRLVLLNLLRALYAYVQSDGGSILAAIDDANIRNSLGVTGTLLSLLADTAPKHPSAVKTALEQLAPSLTLGTMWHNEVLTFAWMSYLGAAPSDSDAQRVLTAMATPDYTGVVAALRPFIARTGALASLGIIALDIPELLKALNGLTLYYYPQALELGSDVLHVDFGPAIAMLAKEILAHPLSQGLIDLLVESLQEYHIHEAHPIEAPLSHWHLRMANLCADSLATLSAAAVDPMKIVVRLPEQWPALRVCQAVVKSGRTVPEVVDYGVRVCKQNMRVAGNISRDRDQLLADLRTRGLLPEDLAAQVGHSFDAHSDSTRLDTEIEINPGSIFEQLHGAVTTRNAVSFLWEWSCESRDWRSTLVGHVHRSCFGDRALSVAYCREACAMMIESATNVRSSALSSQNSETFARLRDWIDSIAASTPEVNYADDFLSQSQSSSFALIEALMRATDIPTDQVIRDVLPITRGWVEDVGHWIQEGQLTFGSGEGRGTVYFPPALRIALAASGAMRGVGDLGSTWMTERAAVRRCLAEASPSWIHDVIRQRSLNETEREEVVVGISKLEQQILRTPWQGDLWQSLGYLQLLTEAFAEARSSFLRCLALPNLSSSTVATAHYNLACVHARIGEPDVCRQELIAAVQAGYSGKREDVMTDPDFAQVRQEAWFQLAIKDLPTNRSVLPEHHKTRIIGRMWGSIRGAARTLWRCIAKLTSRI